MKGFATEQLAAAMTGIDFGSFSTATEVVRLGSHLKGLQDTLEELGRSVSQKAC